MKIVLASQSPRRKELLGRMGLEFVTQASKIDESAFDGLAARELVATLSREKAQWIARQLDGETLVIGADTVVVRDGAALGKPKDAEDAVAMLLSLSGRDHQVCTGVTVCRGDRVLTQVGEAERREEIFVSKDALQQLLGKEVSIYAYSNGRYDEEVLAMMQEAGYKAACAVAGRPLNRQFDLGPYAYPRLSVEEATREMFRL